MTVIESPGEVTNAFDHLAAYGIAAIVDALQPGSVRLAWSDELEPRITLDGATWAEIGVAVHDHAVDHQAPESWVSADGCNNGSASSLFSPRVKAMGDAEMRLWYADRERVLNTIAGWWAQLDRAMIGALGEPSYWSFESDGPRPDYGASRWEMKTRNRGEEFVANRLRPLARAVAARSTDDVARGLSGALLVDEVGGDSAGSRTPTGLMSPRATDNARAWCALWGLSLLPVLHSSVGASRSAGHLGYHSQGHLFLPLMIRSMPVAQLRAILVSRQLAVAATTELADSRRGVRPTLGSERGAAWSWLAGRGVPAVIRFSVHRSPNRSAPEKWAQRGVLVFPEESR